MIELKANEKKIAMPATVLDLLTGRATYDDLFRQIAFFRRAAFRPKEALGVDPDRLNPAWIEWLDQYEAWAHASEEAAQSGNEDPPCPPGPPVVIS